MTRPQEPLSEVLKTCVEPAKSRAFLVYKHFVPTALFPTDSGAGDSLVTRMVVHSFRDGESNVPYEKVPRLHICRAPRASETSASYPGTDAPGFMLSRAPRAAAQCFRFVSQLCNCPHKGRGRLPTTSGTLFLEPSFLNMLNRAQRPQAYETLGGSR